MTAAETAAVTTSTRLDGFRTAVRELRAIVGEEFVHVDAATRAHWARSTLPEGTRALN